MIPIVRPINPGSLERGALEQAIEALSILPRLQGIAKPGNPPLLLFRVPPEGARIVDHLGMSTFFPYAMQAWFGDCRGIIGSFPTIVGISNITVFPEDSAFRSLDEGKFRAVFLNGKRVVSAFDVDCQGALSEMNGRWEEAGANPTLIEDRQARCWEVVAILNQDFAQHPSVMRTDLTAREWLSIGWVRVYQARLFDLQRQLAAFKESGKLFSLTLNNDTPIKVKNFFSMLEQSDWSLGAMLAYFKLEGTDLEKVVDLCQDCAALFTDLNQWGCGQFLRECIESHLWSAQFTECGQCVVWSDPVEGCLKTIRLAPGHFSPPIQPESYWKRLLWDLPSCWGHLVDGSSVPVDAIDMTRNHCKFPQTENKEETRATTKALLAEAVENKKFSIPSKAIVEVPIGIFSHLEMTEAEGNVMVAFWTDQQEFFTALVEPEYNLIDFVFPRGDGSPAEMETKESVEAAVKLLLASIVRDFWVMESRETVFSEGMKVVRGPRVQGNESELPRVVYLPRVRYHKAANLSSCAEQLEHQQRRTHPVLPHLRKATHASEEQLALARRYGFTVPQGYTFVRPHDRGGASRQVIYRSRSALRSLYTVIEDSEVAPTIVNWFQFERDVHELMGSLQFTVEHVAAARRGDNGVDVYATKGSDLEQVNWIIQCKCWRSNRVVGPSVVRQLVGTLADYPSGTRGMIVTTSSFSTKAVETAERHNIRLMNGEEFAKRVAKVQEG